MICCCDSQLNTNETVRRSNWTVISCEPNDGGCFLRTGHPKLGAMLFTMFTMVLFGLQNFSYFKIGELATFEPVANRTNSRLKSTVRLSDSFWSISLTSKSITNCQPTTLNRTHINFRERNLACKVATFKRQPLLAFASRVQIATANSRLFVRFVCIAREHTVSRGFVYGMSN